MCENLDWMNLRIEKTGHDLGTAQIAYCHISKYTGTNAFHYQLIVEK